MHVVKFDANVFKEIWWDDSSCKNDRLKVVTPGEFEKNLGLLASKILNKSQSAWGFGGLNRRRKDH